MTVKLFFQAIFKFFAGLVLFLLLLLIPAGTFYYAQAWLLSGILFIPMFCAGILMMIKNPGLLKKRLHAKEEQNEQKAVIILSMIMFIAAFAAAGLCFRFDFLMLPFSASVAASVIFLASYILYAEVLRENVYLSRTIEVQENQKVIDTGLYGVVRHPMYSSTLILFLSMPIVLGSVISFVIMLFYIPVIALRMKNEEQVLEKGLFGYSEYKKRVKYKIIPFIW